MFNKINVLVILLLCVSVYFVAASDIESDAANAVASIGEQVVKVECPPGNDFTKICVVETKSNKYIKVLCQKILTDDTSYACSALRNGFIYSF
jgi:hypothetical protein